MAVIENESLLSDIPVSQVNVNPENPRLVFRPGELEELTESIRRYGVQVPVTVYREGHRYVLIDGERRWRSSLKLNKRTIPALIQSKPDLLTNLLLMFNIHALREQWDLLTIALKLPRVIGLLFERDRKKPTERELAEYTGLTQGVIRRCKLLIEMPDKYKQDILEELKKPGRDPRERFVAPKFDDGVREIADLKPGGKYVAYTLDEGGKQGLWVRQTAVAASVRIVPPAETQLRGLVFSHDDTRVYYAAFPRNDLFHGAVYEVPVLGGQTRKIVDDTKSPITLSPNQHQIAFIRNNQPQRRDDLIIAGIVVIGAIGLLADQLVRRVRAPACPWQEGLTAAPE